MEGSLRDLTIAVVGAVIGTLVLTLCTAGFRWTAKSREARKKQRETDIADWKSGDTAKRQRVFYAYLFSVLKYFIVGSILIEVATAISDLEPNEPGLNAFDYFTSLMDTVGALLYVITLVEILQFTRLMRSSDS
ncbi:MAG: hypothetical protein WA280_18310 [Xanthobacteraceae bacterium]